MTDKFELPKNHDDNEESPENNSDHQNDLGGQDIFEQRFHELMDGFGEQCKKHGVELAIAIAVYPTPDDLDSEDIERFEHPMVYFRGQILDSMSLTAEVLRNFKTGISQSLDTDPYANPK
jgi:hypothetical protein